MVREANTIIKSESDYKILHSETYKLDAQMTLAQLVIAWMQQQDDVLATKAVDEKSAALVTYTSLGDTITNDTETLFYDVPPATHVAIRFAFDDNGEKRHVMVPQSAIMDLAGERKVWQSGQEIDALNVAKLIEHNILDVVTPKQKIAHPETGQSYVLVA